MSHLDVDAHPARVFASPKVPAVFAMFWVVKLLTTGIGESGADFLAKVSLPLAALVGIVGFYAALRMQLKAETYSPVRYWTAVLMVAVFGTMVADGPHIVLGLPYVVTAAGYFVALGVLFRVWHRSEGTISVHSITTSYRERYYWLAVLLTFGLGTALGDATAFGGLGYDWSVALFGGLILVPLALWRAGVLDATVAFWSSYVLTRPLGASIADWVGKPAHHGGLGWGDGPVTAVGLVLFAGLVAFLVRTHSDVDSAVDGEPVGIDERA